MSVNEVLEQAKNLKPQEKYLVIETLVQSLNEPDKEIEDLWIEESNRRLEEYRKGDLKTVSEKEFFSYNY